MHELSFAEDILRIVEEVAGSPQRIASVHVTVGPLSGISADSLRFCFGEVAEAKGFGSTRLIIEESMAKVGCSDCLFEFEAKTFHNGCPRCRSFNTTVLSGHEFTVDWVELDDGDNVSKQ